ncbi:MAG TPA: sialidase family protein [Candidatus Limnocylindrales bacterium]
MRRTRRALAVSVTALMLLAAMVPAATVSAAAPADRFLPSAVNAPWAGGEADANPDSATAAWGLCRTAAVDSLNFSYAVPTAAEVDAIVGDAVNNSGASNRGCTTPQNETTIAVNPTNASNVIAGANDYRVCCDFDGLNDGTGWAYYSFDGGSTWGNVQVPGLTAETGGQGNFKLMDSAGDPVMAFGPDGVAYYANIVFSRVSPASGVAVSTSTDGGRTWSAPNMVAYQKAGNFFNDKEWLAAGPNGSVVVTWTVFNQGPHGAGYLSSPIVGAISFDHGHTWNRQGFPISDAAHPYDQGSQVAFGNDGALYVAYEAASPSTGYATDALVLARSTDAGLHWSNAELARVYDDLDCYPMFGGRQTLTGEHFRLNSYPSMSIDPTTGKIAIAWADDQGAGNCGTGHTSFSGTTSNQVKLLQGTWSSIGSATVQTVTSGAGDKVFPAVAANGGTVTVSYYTRGYDNSGTPACLYAIPASAASTSVAAWVASGDVCLDYAARTSSDGFAAETRLTSQGSNPYVQFANGAFIGDYSQVALGSDGAAHAAWTDFRGKPGTTGPNQDVYVRTYTP